MKKLTRSQSRKIRKAIRLARKPGKGVYRDKKGPCCIVGQLCKLEGLAYPSEGITIEYSDHELKNKYNVDLLDRLQTCFDGDEGLDRKYLNTKMIEIVKEYEACKP